ncbi:hypothetical protein MGH68_09925 [Erysipelothrix sp. D19-032]
METRKVEIEERRKYTPEVGNAQEKAKEMRAQLNDAKLEYDDRKARHQELSAKLKCWLKTTMNEIVNLRINNKMSRDLRQRIQQLENRLNIVNSRLERPYESNHGVQAIMNNKSSLFGVHDVVGNVFTATENYEIAITTALASSMMHPVTNDDKAAVNAINFLKKNNAGRATFIPLTVAKPRSVSEDAITVASHVDGFAGVASEFVTNDAVYDQLRDSLLGNVLVVNTIEATNRIAKMLNHNYKIVTMDGDVIHRGGTMTGGKNRNNNTSVMTLKKIKKILNKKSFKIKKNLS